MLTNPIRWPSVPPKIMNLLAVAKCLIDPICVNKISAEDSHAVADDLPKWIELRPPCVYLIS